LSISESHFLMESSTGELLSKQEIPFCLDAHSLERIWDVG
jgi:hypothetical protein